MQTSTVRILINTALTEDIIYFTRPPRSLRKINELLPGKTVAVKGEYSCAVRLPDEKPIGLEVRNGYSYLTLPSIVGYDMFLLK